MQVLSGLDAFSALPARSAVSVGNFDGVHLGHQHIIRTLRASDPSAVAAITFEPHPLSVLRPDLAPPRLTPVDMKRELLAEAGVTHLIELQPTPEVLGVTAEAFWERLRDEARPACLVEGPDFNFGKGAKGNVAKLREWTRGSGVELIVVEPLEVTLPGLQVVPVSSSLARWLVAQGRVADAAACLGRPYTLAGTVVEGYRRGRTIGFPTANLEVVEQLVPSDGVYGGWARVNPLSPRERVAAQPPGEGAPPHRYRAAISIGTAPTFEGARRQVEAYLLDFSGDLYGRRLTLELTEWVRDQMRFPSTERLIERMHADVALLAG